MMEPVTSYLQRVFIDGVYTLCSVNNCCKNKYPFHQGMPVPLASRQVLFYEDEMFLLSTEVFLHIL